MSYLSELRYETTLSKIGLEDFTELENNEIPNISTEGFLDTINEAINNIILKIWEFFKNIYESFKKLFTNIFGSKKVRGTTDLIKMASEIEAISDEDINKEIRKFLVEGKYNPATGVIYAHCLFSDNHRIFSIDNIKKEIESWHDGVIKKAITTGGDVRPLIMGDKKELGPSGSDFAKGMRYTMQIALDAIGFNGNLQQLIESKTIPKVNKKDLLEAAKNIDGSLKDAKQFYDSNYSKIKSEFKKIESEVDKNRKIKESELTPEKKEELRKQNNLLNAYLIYMRILLTPYTLCGVFVQLLSVVSKNIFSEDYVLTKEYKYNKLYHLSSNGQLKWFNRDMFKKPGTMRPDHAATGLGQLLPPRISFAETILGCAEGTPTYFYAPPSSMDEAMQRAMMGVKKVDDMPEEDHVDLYLYEGKPDGDTEYIKHEFINALVGEGVRSKEICVTTQIKIEKVGKVRIHYRPKLKHWDPRKFIRYEMLD